MKGNLSKKKGFLGDVLGNDEIKSISDTLEARIGERLGNTDTNIANMGEFFEREIENAKARVGALEYDTEKTYNKVTEINNDNRSNKEYYPTAGAVYDFVNDNYYNKTEINDKNSSYDAKINQVEALAKGASRAIAFETYEVFCEYILAEGEAFKENYPVGTTILIAASGVPDLWYYEEADDYRGYIPSDNEIMNELAIYGYVHIGHYKFAEAETSKMIMDGYVQLDEFLGHSQDKDIHTTREEKRTWSNKLEKANGNGGFLAGDYLEKDYNDSLTGVVIGKNAHAEQLSEISPVVIGEDAGSNDGVAIGYKAAAIEGGTSIGVNASGGGVSIGYDAKAIGRHDVIIDGEVVESIEKYPIDAIQLGSGTNKNEKTLQVYGYQLLDAEGNIPKERLKNAGGGGGDNLADKEDVSNKITTDYLNEHGWNNAELHSNVKYLSAYVASVLLETNIANVRDNTEPLSNKVVTDNEVPETAQYFSVGALQNYIAKQVDALNSNEYSLYDTDYREGYVRVSGIFAAHTSYRITEPIFVTKGLKIKYKLKHGTQLPIIALYRTNEIPSNSTMAKENLIDTVLGIEGVSEGVYEVPSDGYICFVELMAHTEGYVIFENSIFDDIKDYVKSYVNNKVESCNNLNLNILCLGDSIFGNDGEIVDYLAQFTGSNVIKGAIGGSRASIRISNTDAFQYLDGQNLVQALTSGDWTNQDSAVTNLQDTYTWLPSRVETLKSIDLSKIDLVIMNWGTNDYAGGQTLQTIISAYNEIIDSLQSAYPELRLLITTPIWRYSNDTENGDNKMYADATLQQIAEAIETFAKEKRVHVLNAYQNMPLNYNTAKTYFDTDDGVHLNKKGNKVYAHLLNGKIRSLY